MPRSREDAYREWHGGHPPGRRHPWRGPASTRSTLRRQRLASLAFRLNHFLSRLFQMICALVFAAGFLIIAVTVHNLYPIEDPISKLSWLDHVSHLLGIHKQSFVVVFDLGCTTSTVFIYLFHRHLSDGTFRVAYERKKVFAPGVFLAQDRNLYLEELLSFAKDEVPYSRQVSDGMAHPDRPLLLVQTSSECIHPVSLDDIRKVRKDLTTKVFNSSNFHFDLNTNFGILPPNEEIVLQWFSINLLRHHVKQRPSYDIHVEKLAVILDVGDKDVALTVAVNDFVGQRYPLSQLVTDVKRVNILGTAIKLITISIKHLGLYAARSTILKSTSSNDEQVIRSECINPLTRATWRWLGKDFTVLGKKEPDFLMVKERNGPFSGKKGYRPVANYDECHGRVVKYLDEHINASVATTLKNILQGHEIFIEGLLLDKAMERGLTLPFKGGDFRLKQLIDDTLNRACKMPNSDQAFACIDLVYLTSMLDKVFGLKSATLLKSSCNVDGMTAEWPLAAAFYSYENGL